MTPALNTRQTAEGEEKKEWSSSRRTACSTCYHRYELHSTIHHRRLPSSRSSLSRSLALGLVAPVAADSLAVPIVPATWSPRRSGREERLVVGMALLSSSRGKADERLYGVLAEWLSSTLR